MHPDRQPTAFERYVIVPLSVILTAAFLVAAPFVIMACSSWH